MENLGKNRFLSILSLFLFFPLSLQGLEVFVSIPPQAFLVERIAHGHANVEILISQRNDPHTFELNFSKLKNISKADAYFLTGIEAENRLKEKLFHLNNRIKIFESSKGIPWRSYTRFEGNGKDPHFWLNPVFFKIQAKNIFSDLSKLDEKNGPIFERNFSALAKELDDLHNKIMVSINPYRGWPLFVYHPAFGYFADAYGLVQISFEQAGMETSPHRAIEFVERAKRDRARFLLTTLQTRTRNAEEIARRLKIPLLVFDPLEKEYVSNLQRLSLMLRKEFEKEK